MKHILDKIQRLACGDEPPYGQMQRLRARLPEFEALIAELVPLPWCPGCKAECDSADDRMCCSTCETEVISPMSEHAGRVVELESHLTKVHEAAGVVGNAPPAALLSRIRYMRDIESRAGRGGEVD